MIRGALVLALVGAIGCERREPAPVQPAPSKAAPPASHTAAPTASTPSSKIEQLEPAAAPDPEPGAPKPRRLLERPPASWAFGSAGWQGPIDPEHDAIWLERLASAPIVEIVRNKGGATLTLRARFADGSRAAFKPEQAHSAANYRAEIAAYHLDRVLGFGRTAPVVGRSIRMRTLRGWLVHEKTDPEWLARFEREVVVRDGAVRGALIGWHTKRLVGAEPPRGWAKALLDPDAGSAPPGRGLEWSDMVVFDYLLDNTDRWSGGNVLALGEAGPLIFLDNAAGLVRGIVADPSATPVGAVCRFRKRTYEALRQASGQLSERLARSLALDPLAPIVSEQRLQAIDQRLEKLLAQIERCIADHGREIVLAE